MRHGGELARLATIDGNDPDLRLASPVARSSLLGLTCRAGARTNARGFPSGDQRGELSLVAAVKLRGAPPPRR